MQDASAIYLDANSGRPLVAAAEREIQSALAGGVGLSPLWANAQSSHAQGRAARKILNQARERIQSSLAFSFSGADLRFTASGTQASQLAIQSALQDPSGKHWIVGGTEHTATRAMIEWSRAHGAEVTILPTLKDTRPDTSQIAAVLKPNTALISLIWANNETGVLTDLISVAQALASRPDIVLHLDAAAAWGKVPLECPRADLLTLAPHKIGGLSGSGVLAISGSERSAKLRIAQIAGTPPVLTILAAGCAAEHIGAPEHRRDLQIMERQRDWLETELMQRVPGLQVTGKSALRIANTTHFTIQGGNPGLVDILDLAGFCVSAGSACGSGTREASPVLIAAGMDENLAKTAVRISQFEELSQSVLEKLVSTIASAVLRNRGMSEHHSRITH